MKNTNQKTTKNNITELVFILDRSGSMTGLEGDTIGGFNSLIKKQKKQEGCCYVTTILFDNVSEVLHDRAKLEDICYMTDEDYVVRGCTALVDAVGDAIHHISTIHKYAREEDVPQNTMFVIITDGEENASRRYTIDGLKGIIKSKEELGWEFLFIGANIDAITTAEGIGIPKAHAVNYNADSKGTVILYEAVSDAVCQMRSEDTICLDWCAPIEADFSERSTD